MDADCYAWTPSRDQLVDAFEFGWCAVLCGWERRQMVMVAGHPELVAAREAGFDAAVAAMAVAAIAAEKWADQVGRGR